MTRPTSRTFRSLSTSLVTAALVLFAAPPVLAQQYLGFMKGSACRAAGGTPDSSITSRQDPDPARGCWRRSAGPGSSPQTSGRGGGGGGSGGGGYSGGGGGTRVNGFALASAALSFGAVALQIADQARQREEAARQEAIAAEQARIETLRRQRHAEADARNRRANDLFNRWDTGGAIAEYERALRELRTIGDDRNIAVVQRNLVAARMLHAALSDADRVEKARKAYGNNDPYAKANGNPFAAAANASAAQPQGIDDFYHPRLSEDELIRRSRESCRHIEADAPDWRPCVDAAKAAIVMQEESFIRGSCLWYRSAAERQRCALNTHASLTEKVKACARNGCRPAPDTKSENEYVYGCYATHEPRRDATGSWYYVSAGETCPNGRKAERRSADTSLRDSLRAKLAKMREEQQAASAAGSEGEGDEGQADPSVQTAEQVDLVQTTIEESLPAGSERDQILKDYLDSVKGLPPPAKPKGPWVPPDGKWKPL